jgi:Flp pilus assembly protein TadB
VTALLAGGAAGLGLFLLGVALLPGRPGLASRLAAFDQARSAAARPARRSFTTEESQVSRRVGGALAKFCAEQGWQFAPLRANLQLIDRSFENFLATKVMLGVFGLLLAPILAVAAGVVGFSLPLVVPLWLALIFAAIFFMLPDLEVRQKAAERRADMRHAIGAFLDLVSMNLSGGRGVPEALMSASEIGTGWAMWRIRDALVTARIAGQTPWQALGSLGEEVKVDELRDLGAALGLVADDGAKVRESLATRAATLRRRELADLQGEAGERSQSMLVAQMLLCLGFLVFLMYPAVHALLGVA